jgi:hypothetical protein
MGVGDGLQRLDDRELLDGLEHLALAAQARGVDQLELLAVALEVHRDRVAVVPACRTRSGASPSQVLISVLAHVGRSPATARRMTPSSTLSSRLRRASKAPARVQQAARMPWPWAAEIGCGSPMPSSWNSASSGDSPCLGLVDRQVHALAAAQVAAMSASWADEAHVDDEDHRIRLGHGLPWSVWPSP